MRVLIVLGETGQLRYYKEVAAGLLQEGLRPAFCCDRDDPGVRDAIRVAAVGLLIEFYMHAGDREPGELDDRGLRSSEEAGESLRRRLGGERALESTSPAAFLRYHAYRLQEAYRICRDAAPDVITVGEDGIASNMWMITAAKHLGIKVVVLPFGIADSSWLVVKGVEEKARHGELLTTALVPGGEIIEKHYPQWVKGTKHGRAILLPPGFIIALEALGIRIPDPWCLQGGVSDAIFIEGEHMRARYIREGVSKRKIFVTGSVYCDVLHRSIVASPELRLAYERQAPIDPKKFRVLFCVPPSDHLGWGERAAFASVAALVQALGEFFAELGLVDVSYSLHPRILPEDRRAVEAMGAHSRPEFVVQLIPEHDLLVCCGSSIARWAIAARKLVFNYDMYRFGRNDFPGVASYIHTEDFGQMKAEIEAVLSNPALFTHRVGTAAQHARDMGPIDGKSAFRIAERLRQLA